MLLVLNLPFNKFRCPKFLYHEKMILQTFYSMLHPLLIPFFKLESWFFHFFSFSFFLSFFSYEGNSKP